jgi:Rho GDP-dissociation inhibitor
MADSEHYVDTGAAANYKATEVSLEAALSADTEDESLARWKASLTAGLSAGGEKGVTLISMVLHKTTGDVTVPLDPAGLVAIEKEDCLFSIPEGTQYNMEVHFKVSGDICSGLSFANNVFKGKLRVQKQQIMVGSFAPQAEEHTFQLPVQTAPSGMIARGMYTAKFNFSDDDSRKAGAAPHAAGTYRFKIVKT